MTPRQQKAHDAKIAAWKAMPLPYCITRLDRDADRYVPAGKARFATPRDALDAIARRKEPYGGLYVDFAGAFA